MEAINWDLIQQASNEKLKIEDEFRKKFFGSAENPNYFYEIKATVEVLGFDIFLKTNYNNYKFRRKTDGTFVFKKDKISQYFYELNASYTLENWQKGIQAAQKDFDEVLNISGDIIKWLEQNSKKTIGSSMKKFYSSFFGKKQKIATIEFKNQND